MAIQQHTALPTRRAPRVGMVSLVFIALTAVAAPSGCGTAKTASEGTQPGATADRAVSPETSAALVAEGQCVFRFETFGDEQLWTDTLRLHEVVEKSVDPTTALKVGFKVDADVLPPGILDKVDLNGPATTVVLLKMNAVGGIQATVDSNDHGSGRVRPTARCGSSAVDRSRSMVATTTT